MDVCGLQRGPLARRHLLVPEPKRLHTCHDSLSNLAKPMVAACLQSCRIASPRMQPMGGTKWFETACKVQLKKGAVQASTIAGRPMQARSLKEGKVLSSISYGLHACWCSWK